MLSCSFSRTVARILFAASAKREMDNTSLAVCGGHRYRTAPMAAQVTWCRILMWMWRW